MQKRPKRKMQIVYSFKRIMERFKPKIKFLQTDHGGEFKNAKLKEYCKLKNIELIHYNLYNKNSMSIVESMNGLISKIMSPVRFPSR